MADSTQPDRHHRARRRRLAPVAVVAGVLASAALAASLTGALGAFTAKITNSVNNAATGNLTMQETGTGALGTGTTRTSYTCTSNDGSTGSVSTNSATCATINKYGGSTAMVPGTPVTTSVTLKNTGSVNASGFTLTPGACSQAVNGSVSGTATDLCSKMTIQVVEQRNDATGTAIAGGSSTVVTTQSLAAFYTTYGTAGAPLAPVPAGYSATYTFTITLPSQGASPADNAYQGLQASQSLAWQFTS